MGTEKGERKGGEERGGGGSDGEVSGKGSDVAGKGSTCEWDLGRKERKAWGEED